VSLNDPRDRKTESFSVSETTVDVNGTIGLWVLRRVLL
jgi:hypothetical protein